MEGSLLNSNDEQLGVLKRALREGSIPERVEAARWLREFGGEAVLPLCDALEDPLTVVRRAAARSLGEIGDPRAIDPLARALHRCFIGGSPRKQLTYGRLGTIGAGLFGLGCLLLWPFALLEALQALFQGLYAFGRRTEPQAEQESLLAAAYVSAVAQIAERSPTPELRSLLPDLKAASADLLFLDGRTRRISRQAAARIDRLTTRLKSLPLAGATPEPEAEDTAHDLPFPARSSGPNGADLPRIGGDLSRTE